MMSPWKMLVGTVAVAALAACGGTYDPAAMGTQGQNVLGDTMPTGRGAVKGEAHGGGGGGGGGGSTSNGINYHGGPVMLGSVNIHYIWYGNWSGNTATTLLPALPGDLSGSGYEHIDTTYYDGSNNHVSGLLSLTSQTTDSYSRGTSLADSDIQAIVAAQNPTDTNGIYFVLTSSDVNETSGFCTKYCGWHTHATINGLDIKYSFVGNPDRCPSACEAQTTSPNGNAGADGMASIIAHESEEAISDPDLNAWYDRRGSENADKCAWTFGTESTATNGSKYNFTATNGDEWLIQQNWVNASGGYCAMSY